MRADGGGVEQVGVVLERARAARRASRRAPAPGRTWRVGCSTLQRAQRAGPAACSVGMRRVLQGEHHLEERRAAQVALGLELLDQLLEGQVLVGVGAERGLAHAAQQLAEGGVAVEAGAQHERVDEEADEALQSPRGVRPAMGEPTTMSSWPE